MATIDTSDLKRLAKELERLKLDSKARKRILNFAGNVIRSDIIDNFDNRKQNSDLTPWAEWSDRYTLRQFARGRAQPENTLIDTGTLRASIQFDADDRELFVGSNESYAAAVDDKREFLWFSVEAGETIEDFIIDRIFEG